MEAHVICLNDSVQAIVIGTEAQAQTKLVELSEAYFRSQRWSFGSDEVEQRRAYRWRCHWYVRTPQLFKFTPTED